MTQVTEVAVLSTVDEPNAHQPALAEDEEDRGERVEAITEAGEGLTPSQREVLERCLHALTHAKNDSHTLAALLLVGTLKKLGCLNQCQWLV